LPRDGGISSTYGGPITQNVADGEWQRWFMAKLFLRVSIHRDLTFIRFGVFRVVMVVVVVVVVRAVVFVMVIGVIAGVLDFEITHGGGLYEYPNTAADFSTHATRTMNARGMWGMLVPHEPNLNVGIRGAGVLVCERTVKTLYVCISKEYTFHLSICQLLAGVVGIIR
jgi:hypothetical protein